MDLGRIMLSEIAQKEKDKNHMISLMCNIKQKVTNELTNKNKLIDTDNRMVVTIGEEGGRRVKWVKGVKYIVIEGN